MEKIREFIRKIIQESSTLINEVGESKNEPIQFEFFHPNNNQYQYGFVSDNTEVYYLNFFNQDFNINSIEVFSGEKDENNEPIKTLLSVILSINHSESGFLVNFHHESQESTNRETYKTVLKKNKPLTLMSNIIWLLEDFLAKFPHTNILAFSTEDLRRAGMYTIFLEKQFGRGFKIFKGSMPTNRDVSFIIKRKIIKDEYNN